MPAPAFQLKRLSPMHEAIADYLIANPGKGVKSRCAAHFGITQAWLSTIMNTDAFRAMMKAKQQDLHALSMESLGDKINGLAHASLEKLGQVLDTTNDERLVRDIAKDTLAMAGFSPSTKPAGNGPTYVQNNTYNVNSDALAAARERRLQHYSGGDTLESNPNTQALSDETAAQRISADLEIAMGQTSDLRSQPSDSAEKVHWTEEEGSSV